MTWNVGKPPNEQVVEVEDDGGVIRVRAIWGRDGTRRERLLAKQIDALTHQRNILKAALKEIADSIRHDPDCWSESGAWQSSEREKLISKADAIIAGDTYISE